MLCTPADLYRDCHGKGLTPDSDAWVTDFKADIVDQATIQVRYRNQHYNVQKDMQTGQVISCKNDYDFDVNMTLKRLPPLKDPFAHPPLPTSPPTTPAPHDGNSPLGPILDKILYSPATHPLHRSH
jgi:hypothetical protein